MTQSQPPLGLARFESSSKTMTFIKSQKMHKGNQEQKLWVAENRTREERCRLKVVSKIKKYLIELGGHAPKDVVASYKMFRVVIRANSKLIPVATVHEDLRIQWLDMSIASEPIKTAMDQFIADME